jgi:hypothetical protein
MPRNWDPLWILATVPSGNWGLAAKAPEKIQGCPAMMFFTRSGLIWTVGMFAIRGVELRKRFQPWGATGGIKSQNSQGEKMGSPGTGAEYFSAPLLPDHPNAPNSPENLLDK